MQVEEERRSSSETTLNVFGVCLGFLATRTGQYVSSSLSSIPSILLEFRYWLSTAANIETKDLLLLQSNCRSIYAFVGDIDSGNPTADWRDTPAVSSAFRLFLEGLETPLFGPSAFAAMATAAGNYIAEGLGFTVYGLGDLGFRV